ncbi:uncharacterized protein LOC119991829 [Tripterygium wilfordii]|uniref:uncharacterized protein LOC119991829 n=1 Tax=Tripterygium wilfordii TaxID=458696 RepID=UPI0018F84B5E|nr:uncharacterized protein LOC119991829 [Tripterygium wilfordii]
MDPPPPSQQHLRSKENDSENNPQMFSSNPIQWPTEFPFASPSMHPAQAAAFAQFYQQQFLTHHNPFNNFLGGVSNTEYQPVDPHSSSCPNTHTNTVVNHSYSEAQPPSTQNTSRSTQATNRKSPNWKINEDVALCQSWIRISEDPIVGNGQAHDACWLSIWKEFKQGVHGTERPQRACENR